MMQWHAVTWKPHYLFVVITDRQRMRTNLYCRTRHCSTSESTFPRPWSKSSLYWRTDPRVCTSFLPPSIPPLLCSYPSHGSNVIRHKWTARNNADHFQIPTTTKRSCYSYSFVALQGGSLKTFSAWSVCCPISDYVMMPFICINDQFSII